MSFIKAENALKRSEELLAVGRPVEALDTLRTALSTRRFKFSWTEAMEDIVKSYVRLSFELREVRNLKEGFLQYRSAGHFSSFDRCVRYLLEYAQSRVPIRSKDEKLATIEVDLEETERPEALLLRAFSTEDDIETAIGKTALRDLWESFRIALDLTRAHAPFEDLYHEIARRACQFCLQYRRLNEFRRLCELLRLHYSYLPRQAAVVPPSGTAASGAMGGGGGPQVVSGQHPETVQKQLETRMVQLSVSLELELYSVGFLVAEDVQNLMTKKKPSGNFLKQYFGRIAELFDHTNNAIFHAYALLRHAVLARQEEAIPSSLADKLVLASLAASVTDHLGDGGMETEVHAEKNAKMAALVSGGGAVPTTEGINTELVTKGLLTLASAAVQKAFHNMVDGDGEQVHELVRADNKYMAAIGRAIFVKKLNKTAAVYSRMPLTAFKEELCERVEFGEAEKIMLTMKKTGGVEVKIDYENGVVKFARGAGGRVKDFSRWLRTEVDLEKDREEVAEQRRRIKRKEKEMEMKKTTEEKMRMKAMEEQEEKDKEILKKMKEEEMKRKENELREKIKFSRESEKAKDLDERLKDDKLRKEWQNATDSKTLGIIVKEMEKQLEFKIKKEINTKLQTRKSEFKKINLTAKVLRYEEAKKIANFYKPEIQAKDRAYLDGIQQKREEELQKAKERKEEMEKMLTPAKELLMKFKNEKMEERKEKLQTKINKAREMHMEKFAREAIQVVFEKFGEEEEEEEYYERMADILRVDSTQSREDFKK